ncbi:MAG: AraC family transcriptional regulator [Clostridia bacterium]|nr:AraC family transcriptional regulator [Clostridia bacterium]
MKDISLYEKIPQIENNFTVKFQLFSREGGLIPHWHEHLELLYFTKGQCELICDGQSFDVSAGDLVVVNSTEIHSFSACSPLEYTCILIYPPFFADIKFDNVRLKNLVRADEKVKEYITSINDEYTEKRPGYDMMLKGHTYALLTYLMRSYPDASISHRDFEARAVKLRRLNHVIEHIKNNYTEKITTKALAEMCFLSEAHFCRFFKGAMGKSAIEYINEYRVQKAAILLRNTDESISHIALTVGFDDINYFSRTFKKITGAPPGKYRIKSATVGNKS